MIRFNDTNIFIGYIKQLLKSFNLPKYHIYTQEQEDYHNNYIHNQIKLQQELTNIERSLAIIEEELDTEDSPEELLKEKEQLNKRKVEIKAQLIPEKDVIVSMYRTYQGSDEPKYPSHMRYVPYIRHDEIQYYAPTIVKTTKDIDGGRETETTVLYSDDD